MFEAGQPVHPSEQLRELESRLRLRVETGRPQDWGLEFADGDRLDEFIDFFLAEHSAGWDDFTRAEFVDLVLSSADERLNADQPVRLEHLRHFLEAVPAGEGVDRTLEQWAAIDSTITHQLWPSDREAKS